MFDPRPVALLMLSALALAFPPAAHSAPRKGDIAVWPTPSAQTRPWTRWWWLGSAVDRENLARLLRTYHAAGLGGVEITPIYGVQGQDAREIDYLSPAWLEMLRFTCAEAAALGMGVDMPTGTGWPFGGPRVPADDAPDRYRVAVFPLPKGAPFRWPAGQALPRAITATSRSGETKRLDAALMADGLLDWRAPSDGWSLYALVERHSGMQVKRAAPGAAGYCINPFSASSLDRYLAGFDAPFAALPRGAVRCQFHDSFEYSANWSPDLLELFRMRRGYDLRDHLDALAGNGDPVAVARVKTDYRQTLGELLLESFTRRWTAWAHAHGSRSRNQAHGSPGNLLDLYGAVDIPETETFGPAMDVRAAKFASSAAHVMGRPLASSETCTWLGEHFTVTLAQAKPVVDHLFAAGINHIFYHGTAYSPVDAPWPGWLFYASTGFQPTDPIWHDFPALNAYVTRCQSILQAGRPDNDVLLYWPLSDLWQQDPAVFQLTIDARWLTSQPVGRTAQSLWDEGVGWDYVSDAQLSGASVRAGRVRVPGGNYRTVVVPPCRFVPLGTVKALIALAAHGATVVFERELPTDVPGLADLSGRRAALHEALSALPFGRPDHAGNRVAAVGRGRVVLAATLPEALALASVRAESLARRPGVELIRRANGATTDYFVANHGEQAVEGWVDLATPARTVVLMDPMTGAVGAARMGERPGKFWLQLSPGQSLILRASTRALRRVTAWTYREAAGPAVEPRGEWRVEFVEGGPTIPPAYSLPAPAPWTDGPAAGEDRFAGTARYTLVFDSPRPDWTGAWELDLGRVAESARVRVNGEERGTLFAPPFRLRVPVLRARGNRLEVDVTNVAANRIRAMDRDKQPWRVFKEINFVGADYRPFNAADWPVRSAGLLGPVRVTPLRSPLGE